MNLDKVFVVIGYTPTTEKEQLLRNFLTQLKQTNIPICLVLHNIPSKDIIDSVDYFIFDKENTIITRHKSTHGYHVGYQDNISLKSLYDISSQNNYGLAALRLMYLGLNLAKSLSYKKCCVVEYDSDIQDFTFIHENFNELDSFDSISFNGFDILNRDFLILGQINFFNLINYSSEEFYYNLEKLKQHFKNPSFNGMAELILAEELIKPKNYKLKHYSLLKKNNLNLNLSNTIDNRLKYMCYPIYQSDSIYVFLVNNDLTKIKLDVIINDTKHIPRHILPGNYHYFPLHINLEKLESIDFFVNKQLITRYDFVNDIDKVYFKNHSFNKMSNK